MFCAVVVAQGCGMFSAERSNTKKKSPQHFSTIRGQEDVHPAAKFDCPTVGGWWV